MWAHHVWRFSEKIAAVVMSLLASKFKLKSFYEEGSSGNTKQIKFKKKELASAHRLIPLEMPAAQVWLSRQFPARESWPTAINWRCKASINVPFDS